MLPASSGAIRVRLQPHQANSNRLTQIATRTGDGGTTGLGAGGRVPKDRLRDAPAQHRLGLDWADALRWACSQCVALRAPGFALGAIQRAHAP